MVENEMSEVIDEVINKYIDDVINKTVNSLVEDILHDEEESENVNEYGVDEISEDVNEKEKELFSKALVSIQNDINVNKSESMKKSINDLTNCYVNFLQESLLLPNGMGLSDYNKILLDVSKPIDEIQAKYQIRNIELITIVLFYILLKIKIEQTVYEDNVMESMKPDSSGMMFR